MVFSNDLMSCAKQLHQVKTIYMQLTKLDWLHLASKHFGRAPSSCGKLEPRITDIQSLKLRAQWRSDGQDPHYSWWKTFSATMDHWTLLS